MGKDESDLPVTSPGHRSSDYPYWHISSFNPSPLFAFVALLSSSTGTVLRRCTEPPRTSIISHHLRGKHSVDGTISDLSKSVCSNWSTPTIYSTLGFTILTYVACWVWIVSRREFRDKHLSQLIVLGGLGTTIGRLLMEDGNIVSLMVDVLPVATSLALLLCVLRDVWTPWTATLN